MDGKKIIISVINGIHLKHHSGLNMYLVSVKEYCTGMTTPGSVNIHCIVPLDTMRKA